MFKLVIVISGIIGGIFLEIINPSLYLTAKDLIKKTNYEVSIKMNGYSKCSLSEINFEDVSQDDNNVLIIGHAYSLMEKDKLLSNSKLLIFIEKNKVLIDKIFFTGDIYKNPSKLKWAELKIFLDEMEIEFEIAPGNHDVGFGDNTKRDIFTDAFSDQYPLFDKTIDNSLSIILDSTEDPWAINKEGVDKIIESNKNINEDLYLFSHHLLHEISSKISNSLEGFPENFSINKNHEILKELRKNFKSITSISGDIGAFNYQPGLECLKKNEIMYVSSGLGEKKDNDLIGIINNKLYKTKI